MPKDSKIFQDIEATAGFYGPSLYSEASSDLYGLLSHFHDLDLSEDSEGANYTPMTAAKPDRQSKLFAVGVLPPSANVTGKILDRSATIARDVTFIPPENPNDNVGKTKAEGTPPGSGWGSAVGRLSEEFWTDFVGMCRRVGVDPVEWASIVYHESGFDSTSANYGVPGTEEERKRREENNPIAVGLNQFIRGAAKSSGMTDEEFENHANTSPEDQLYWMERYLRRIRPKGNKRTQLYGKHFGGLNNPDGSRYASVRGQNYYVQDQIAAGLKPRGTTRYDLFPRSDFQANAYRLNAALDDDNSGTILLSDLERKVRHLPPQAVVLAIRAAEDSLGDSIPEAPGKPGGEDEEKSDWATGGSADAKLSTKEREKLAGVPLNQRELGRKFQAAQRQAIAEAQNALNGMKRTPPLRLLVNPQQFAVKGSKIVSDGNWSRRGPVIEHWGDEQDVISASGKVAAFYTAQTGLTRVARQFSASWRNLQSLYLLYKNNGAIYLSDSFDPSGRDRRLTYVGSIYIYYDGILYIGSFVSFNLTENDTTPYTVEYSFEFNVRAAFILDRPDDKYSLQYSYANKDKDQPKPPLPTKSEPAAAAAAVQFATEQMVLGQHGATEAEKEQIQALPTKSAEDVEKWTNAREDERKSDGTTFFEEQVKKNKNKDKVPSDVRRALRR